MLDQWLSKFRDEVILGSILKCKNIVFIRTTPHNLTLKVCGRYNSQVSGTVDIFTLNCTQCRPCSIRYVYIYKNQTLRNEIKKKNFFYADKLLIIVILIKSIIFDLFFGWPL